MAFVGGLNNSSIRRLHYLRIKCKNLDKLNYLSELMDYDMNFSQYRKCLSDISTDNENICIPCIGLIKSDYQHILEVNAYDHQNNCLNKKIINSSYKTAQNFKKFQNYSTNKNNKNQKLRNYFKTTEVWDNERLHEKSQHIYPKNENNNLKRHRISIYILGKKNAN